MIEKIKLLNFVSHKDTELSLGAGVTVFVGRNGAGKSSVIDGITYALYGEHMRGDNESLVKKGAMMASASVTFSVGGREYVAERKVNNRGNLEGSVLKEITGGMEKQLAAGERRQFGESLSEEVGKVIGLDYARMRVAAIIQQGELDSIVTKFSPKEFKELVNSLIGIDKLEFAYQEMLTVLNDFRTQLRDKYGYDDTNIETLASSIALAEASLKSDNDGLGKAETALDTLKKAEAKLASKVRALEPLREMAHRVLSDIGNLLDYVDSERAKLGKKLEEFERIVKESPKYILMVGRETETRMQLEATAKLISEEDDFIAVTSTEVGGLMATKRAPAEMKVLVNRARTSLVLVSGKGDLQAKLKGIKVRIASLDSSFRTLEKESTKLQAHEETATRLEFKNNLCPVCGSKVTKINEFFDIKTIRTHLAEHREEAGRIESLKTSLDSERVAIEADLASATEAEHFLSANGIDGEGALRKKEAELKSLEVDLRSLPSLIVQLKRANKTKTELVERQSNLTKRMNEVSVAKAFLSEHKVSSREDLRRLSGEMVALGRILSKVPKDLEPMRETIDLARLRSLEIDEHSRGLFSQIRSLIKKSATYDVEDYEEKARALELLRSKAIPEETAKVELLNRETRAEKETLASMTKTITELRKARDLTAVLSKIRDKIYYRDGPVPTSLRSWALNQIGLKASEYASSFGIGVSNIQLREKARNVTIECYGARGGVETASLSGGEKVAVALALRFGMAYVMGGYKLDFIVLDEPTIHLDPERKASMVNIISSLGTGSSPLKQVIIITHDSEIFENADVEAVYKFETTPEGTRVRLEGEDRRVSEGKPPSPIVASA